MKVIESWDIEVNFWEVNPQLKVPSVFRKLYESDKSKGKAHSSKLMWAVAFYADFDSKYRNLSEEERKQLVLEDILRDPTFDFSTLTEQIQAWELFKTAAQKQMTEWERFMNEKTTYLKELKYDKDTADEIEKRLLSNTKLYDEYQKIMERLSKEGDAGIMWGGGQESLIEKGEI